MGGSFISPSIEEHPEAGKKIWGWGDWRWPQASPPNIHVHAGVEVGIVLEGQQDILFGGVTMTCKVGDVWLCAMWEPHGDRVPPCGVRTLVRSFHPQFIGDEMLGELPWLTLFMVPPQQRPRVTNPELRQKVLALGEHLACEKSDRRPSWESVMRLVLLLLLTELARDWRPDPEVMPQAPGSSYSALLRIMPALRMAHSPPWRRIPVREAATMCSLSESRFYALFKRTIGMSYGEFCLRARLAFAAHKLLRTEDPIDGIAAEAGFFDDSHFHHSFVRHNGCTPGEYRRSRGWKGEEAGPAT